MIYAKYLTLLGKVLKEENDHTNAVAVLNKAKRLYEQDIDSFFDEYAALAILQVMIYTELSISIEKYNSNAPALLEIEKETSKVVQDLRTYSLQVNGSNR